MSFQRKKNLEIESQRMMSDVVDADIVVTNPTHFAVALRYDEGKMIAPIVLAKGVDDIAFKIKKIALESDVPIMENPPLARALHDSVDIKCEIPKELFIVVAEVLVEVYKIDKIKV